MSADRHNRESTSNAHTKSYNWAHPDAGFLPEDTINLISEFDEIGEGIAHIAETAADEFEEAGGEINHNEDMVGLIEAIVKKFARGIEAHRIFEEYIENHTSQTILSLKKEHEESGIDVRTDDDLYRVKYCEPEGDTIESCREGWVMNPVTDLEKEVTLICVTTNGKVMKKRNNQKEGDWKVLHK